MNKKINKNKLSIYLIKKEYDKDRKILKNIDQLEKENLKNVGRFYYCKSQNKPPLWIKNFFSKAITKNLKLFNAITKGVLLVRIKTQKYSRTFAVTFGYGKTLLKTDVYEEKFGLKVTLNTVDPERLRKIDKKNMSIMPKDTTEQLTSFGGISNFGIDIEQDLIQSVTGNPSEENIFWKIVNRKRFFKCFS